MTAVNVETEIYAGDVTTAYGGFHLTYTDEASLRDNLARLANLTGWRTMTEVQAGDWGRIDLVLDAGHRRCTLVELKMELLTPRQVRAGLQQIDRYDRWWGSSRGGTRAAWLVVPTEDSLDSDLVARMVELYPNIRVTAAGSLIHHLETGGTSPQTSLYRLTRERHRIDVATAGLRPHALLRTAHRLSRFWPELENDVLAVAMRTAR